MSGPDIRHRARILIETCNWNPKTVKARLEWKEGKGEDVEELRDACREILIERREGRA